MTWIIEMHSQCSCSLIINSYLTLSHLSSVEDLKSKFCSTVANDIMLVSTLGVIRMWADEASRKSRFRILYTTYQERKTLLIMVICTLAHTYWVP